MSATDCLPAAWFDGCSSLEPTRAVLSANGNAVDSIGGRNGTLVGATFNVGISGQAFSFDGGDDYVSVPDDDLWSFGSDPFSLATWVNFNTVKIDNTFQCQIR